MSHTSFKPANKMAPSALRRHIKGMRVIVAENEKHERDTKFYRLRLEELEQALKKSGKGRV